MTVSIFLGALLGPMALGVPIAFALILSGVALMLYLGLFDAQIVAQNVLNGADSFPLMAVPFFLLAGEVMNTGGLSRRIVALAMAMVGHIRGGLGFVAIFAACILSSLSGSAVADAAALGALLLPMMLKSGHDPARAGGLIASASIIGPIIPPSIGFILFGVVGGVSITKLFLAGIFPGLMIAAALSITWLIVARKEQFELRRGRAAGCASGPSSTASGAFPARHHHRRTEVRRLHADRGGCHRRRLFALRFDGRLSRVGAGATLPRFRLGREDQRRRDVLVACAAVSAWLITVADVPGALAALLEPLMGNQTALLIAIMVLIVIVGTAMDMTPTILIMTPVLMPVIKQAGIDPVYFGVLFIINNSIGLITPPVGTVLNVICGVSKLSMEDLMKGVMPFLFAELIVLFLLVLFPELVTVPVSWFGR